MCVCMWLFRHTGPAGVCRRRALLLASGWSPSVFHWQCKGAFRWHEKALLGLHRSCRGALERQLLLKGKSRAVAIALPYRHSLLSDPERSQVNLTEV